MTAPTQPPRPGTPGVDRSGPTGDDLSIDPPDELTWDEEDEFVRVRHGGWRIAGGLLAAVLIFFGGYTVVKEGRAWFDRQLDPVGEPGEAIDLVVPRGATTSDIGVQLANNGVIPNSTFFRYYVEWKDEGNFQAGEYTFYLNSSADEAIAVLNAGPKPPEVDQFIIREGLWTSEILARVSEQLPGINPEQLQAALDGGTIEPRYRPPGETSWEGLLFPDTYEVNKGATATEVLQRMSDEFARVTGSLGYGAAETKLGYSAYEVLIVASLIEAETRVDDERPLVASVIYNRLREQWILGIDATCIYGAGDRDVELTRSVLDQETPYGCRNVRGLPPTPINSPGRASLEAALNPAETDFFYYVLTDPSGRHSFVETQEEFNEKVQICRDLGLC
ncbi:MAG: endolytic transglycosylase MltG [Acidimicrobiales bacterium]|nr:endolytic transglycosylase MltG [Acidimicrobiales bacterium]